MLLMLKRHSAFAFGLLAALALGLAGCGEADGIAQYSAPKEVTTVAARPASGGSAAAWFLKLTGPAEDVAKQYEAFARLMAQFRVDDEGKPSWEVPAGWSEVPPKDLDPQLANARYATLRVDGSIPPLDITITTLRSPDPAAEQYIQLNFNRWRSQLQMPPLEGDDWLAQARDNKELALFGTNSGFIAFANLKGKSQDDKEAQTLAAIIPFVPGGMDRSEVQTSQTPANPSPAPVSPGIKFDAPEGWTATRKPLASVAFSKTEGDESADITVIRLGGGGELLANVNRWRGQVGLEPVAKDALETEAVQVGELEGQLVDLRGTDKTLITVIIPQGEAQWFVKLMGSKGLAEKERERFVEFAKSLRFE